MNLLFFVPTQVSNRTKVGEPAKKERSLGPVITCKPPWKTCHVICHAPDEPPAQAPLSPGHPSILPVA